MNVWYIDSRFTYALYFSLVKMISNITKERQQKKMGLSWKNLDYAVRRNFGGFFGTFHPATTFLSRIKSLTQGPSDVSIINQGNKGLIFFQLPLKFAQDFYLTMNSFLRSATGCPC